MLITSETTLTLTLSVPEAIALERALYYLFTSDKLDPESGLPALLDALNEHV